MGRLHHARASAGYTASSEHGWPSMDRSGGRAVTHSERRSPGTGQSEIQGSHCCNSGEAALALHRPCDSLGARLAFHMRPADTDEMSGSLFSGSPSAKLSVTTGDDLPATNCVRGRLSQILQRESSPMSILGDECLSPGKSKMRVAQIWLAVLNNTEPTNDESSITTRPPLPACPKPRTKRASTDSINSMTPSRSGRRDSKVESVLPGMPTNQDDDATASYMRARRVMTMSDRAKLRERKGTELDEFLRSTLAGESHTTPRGKARSSQRSGDSDRKLSPRARSGDQASNSGASACSSPSGTPRVRKFAYDERRDPKSLTGLLRPPGKNLRVLIIDDEPVARKRVEIMIRRFVDAETIVTATSGLEAVAHVEAAETIFDLIVCDINMGGKSMRDPVNGPAASAKMRQIEFERTGHNWTPIIFLSATSRLSPMYLAFYEVCGATAVLTKPASNEFGKLAASLIAKSFTSREQGGQSPATSILHSGGALRATAKLTEELTAVTRAIRAPVKPGQPVVPIPIRAPSVPGSQLPRGQEVHAIRVLALLQVAFERSAGETPQGHELSELIQRTGFNSLTLFEWFSNKREQIIKRTPRPKSAPDSTQPREPSQSPVARPASPGAIGLKDLNFPEKYLGGGITPTLAKTDAYTDDPYETGIPSDPATRRWSGSDRARTLRTTPFSLSFSLTSHPTVLLGANGEPLQRTALPEPPAAAPQAGLGGAAPQTPKARLANTPESLQLDRRRLVKFS
eukprot:CAMPEP_0179961672 /NCGR_PEP_ID=MMETSP0983-20121128/29815_1 /TAXON_ID=483367 /ORGANISM="non described non described, Strain CCMP 2436" /LENGTH=743 /DNA_ID=CAMNT_0021874137 /DNA_START=65 /DNA_END=2296 /DNA_ORIENTATION=-